MQHQLLLSIALSILLLAQTTLVNAHGYVQTITVNDKAYQAWHPFDDPYATPPPTLIARKVPDDGPITDVNDPGIRCNTGGNQGTPISANVQGGGEVTFTWVRWPDDHHGPVTTYMAACGGSCENFDGSGKVWFKIHQAGLDKNGNWASNKLIANDLKWTVTIPPKLKSGQYLIRHEILALHSAGEPQFYPHCSQLSVTSSGTSTPDASELTSFPGAYDGATTAIFGDIWNQPKTWPIAGPDVAALAGGKGGPNDPDAATNIDPSGGGKGGAATPNSPPTTPSSTKTKTPKPTSTPSTDGKKSGGRCKLKNAPPAKVVGRSLKREWRSRHTWMLSGHKAH